MEGDERGLTLCVGYVVGGFLVFNAYRMLGGLIGMPSPRNPHARRQLGPEETLWFGLGCLAAGLLFLIVTEIYRRRTKV